MRNEMEITMIVHCAWCEKAGRDPFMYEKEPIRDPSISHSICARCTEEMAKEVANSLGPLKNPPKSKRKRRRKRK